MSKFGDALDFALGDPSGMAAEMQKKPEEAPPPPAPAPVQEARPKDDAVQSMPGIEPGTEGHAEGTPQSHDALPWRNPTPEELQLQTGQRPQVTRTPLESQASGLTSPYSGLSKEDVADKVKADLDATSYSPLDTVFGRRVNLGSGAQEEDPRVVWNDPVGGGFKFQQLLAQKAQQGLIKPETIAPFIEKEQKRMMDQIAWNGNTPADQAAYVNFWSDPKIPIEQRLSTQLLRDTGIIPQYAKTLSDGSFWDRFSAGFGDHAMGLAQQLDDPKGERQQPWATDKDRTTLAYQFGGAMSDLPVSMAGMLLGARGGVKGMFAGASALPTFTNELMMDHIQGKFSHGDFKDNARAVLDLLNHTAQSGAIGYATGGAVELVNPVVAHALLNSNRTLQIAGGIGARVVAMNVAQMGAETLINRQVPTLQEFWHGVVFSLGQEGINLKTGQLTNAGKDAFNAFSDLYRAFGTQPGNAATAAAMEPRYRSEMGTSTIAGEGARAPNFYYAAQEGEGPHDNDVHEPIHTMEPEPKIAPTPAPPPLKEAPAGEEAHGPVRTVAHAVAHGIKHIAMHEDQEAEPGVVRTAVNTTLAVTQANVMAEDQEEGKEEGPPVKIITTQMGNAELNARFPKPTVDMVKPPVEMEPHGRVILHQSEAIENAPVSRPMLQEPPKPVLATAAPDTRTPAEKVPDTERAMLRDLDKQSPERITLTPDRMEAYKIDKTKMGDPVYRDRVMKTIWADIKERYDNKAEQLVAWYGGTRMADTWRATGNNPEMLTNGARRYLINAEKFGYTDNGLTVRDEHTRLAVLGLKDHPKLHDEVTEADNATDMAGFQKGARARSALAGVNPKWTDLAGVNLRQLPGGRAVLDPDGIAPFLQKFGEKAGFHFITGPRPDPVSVAHYDPARRQVYLPFGTDAMLKEWGGLNRMDVIFHEVGHAIDYQLGLRGQNVQMPHGGDIPPEIKAEAIMASKLMRPGHWETRDQQDTYLNSNSELMADAVGKWLQDPTIREHMPEFTKAFGARLKHFADLIPDNLPQEVGPGKWQLPQDDLTDQQATTNAVMSRMIPKSGKPGWMKNFWHALHSQTLELQMTPGRRLDNQARWEGLMNEKSGDYIEDAFRDANLGSREHAINTLLNGGSDMANFGVPDGHGLIDTVKRVGDSGETMANFYTWRLAHATLERFDAGANAENSQTILDADRLLNVSHPEWEAKFKPIMDDYIKTLNAPIDYMVAAGRKSAEEGEQMKALNRYNVFFRDASDVSVRGVYTTKGLTSKDIPDAVADIQASDADNVMWGTNQAKVNIAKQTLLNFADAHFAKFGERLMRDDGPVTATDLGQKGMSEIVDAEGNKIWDAKSGVRNPMMSEEVEKAWNRLSYEAKGNSMIIYKDGVPHRYTFDNEDIKRLAELSVVKGRMQGFGAWASSMAKFNKYVLSLDPRAQIRFAWHGQGAQVASENGSILYFRDPVVGAVDYLIRGNNPAAMSRWNEFMARGGGATAYRAYNEAIQTGNALDATKYNANKQNTYPTWQAAAQAMKTYGVTHAYDFYHVLARYGKFVRNERAGMPSGHAYANAQTTYLDFRERMSNNFLQSVLDGSDFGAVGVKDIQQVWKLLDPTDLRGGINEKTPLIGQLTGNVSDRLVAGGHPMAAGISAMGWRFGKYFLMHTMPAMALYAANAAWDQEYEEKAKAREAAGDRQGADALRNMEWRNGSETDKTLYNSIPAFGARIKVPRTWVGGALFETTPQEILEYFRRQDPKAWQHWLQGMIQQATPPIVGPLAAGAGDLLASTGITDGRNIFTQRQVISQAMAGKVPDLRITPSTTPLAKKVQDLLGVLDINAEPAMVQSFMTDIMSTWPVEVANKAITSVGLLKAQQRETAGPVQDWHQSIWTRTFFANNPHAENVLRRFNDELSTFQQAHNSAHYEQQLGLPYNDPMAVAERKFALTADRINKAHVLLRVMQHTPVITDEEERATFRGQYPRGKLYMTENEKLVATMQAEDKIQQLAQRAIDEMEAWKAKHRQDAAMSAKQAAQPRGQ